MMKKILILTTILSMSLVQLSYAAKSFTIIYQSSATIPQILGVNYFPENLTTTNLSTQVNLNDKKKDGIFELVKRGDESLWLRTITVN